MENKHGGRIIDEQLFHRVGVDRLLVGAPVSLRAQLTANLVVTSEQLGGGELIQAGLHRALSLLAHVSRRHRRHPRVVRITTLLHLKPSQRISHVRPSLIASAHLLVLVSTVGTVHLLRIVVVEQRQPGEVGLQVGALALDEAESRLGPVGILLVGAVAAAGGAAHLDVHLAGGEAVLGAVGAQGRDA